MKTKYTKKHVKHGVGRIFLIALALLIIIDLIKIAPNYVREERIAEIDLMINNNNVTNVLKHDILVNDGIPYLSMQDIQNFFDEFLIKEDDYIITTSNTKTVKIASTNPEMNINGATVKMTKSVINQDDTIYFPIDEMAQVYNYEFSYNTENNIVIIDSLNRKLIQATSSKDQEIKYKATIFSKTIDNIKRGDKVVIIQNNKREDSKIDDWVKVRTKNGFIGYVKQSSLINRTEVRDDLEVDKINGKVSIMWDYYNSYTSAPTRTEKIEGINVVSPSFYELEKDSTLSTNIGESGINYINWAHSNGYKVWPTCTNTYLDDLDAMSGMMSNFDTRKKLIDNIIATVSQNQIDGINIDFENMYMEDKDKYSRFLIELAPRLQEIGLTMTVEVTAPDGAETWSLCYDRNTIGKVADYVIFIGYDQNTGSAKEAGSVSAANWQELNINKFIGLQEEVPKEKLIVATAFYTRLWKEEDGELTNRVVNMRDITIPNGAQVTWNDTEKQNYMEYTEGDATYKMWIEDEQSISAKLDLINKYDLAGAGFWEKDREKDGIWKIVSEKLGI